MTVGAGPQHVRFVNERIVVAALREASPQRAAELATTTGLSRVSIIAILESLMERGWVTEKPMNPTGAKGRPARIFSYLADSGGVLGVDIGAFAVRCIVADMNGTEVGRSEAHVTPVMTADARWAAVAQAIEVALAAAGMEAGSIWASALAVTGSVDRDSGDMLRSGNIPSLQGVNIVAAARPHVPGVIFVENDARAATWAELKAGVAAGDGSLVHILLGRRPAAGLALGGQLHRGVNSMSGDLDRSVIPGFPLASTCIPHGLTRIDIYREAVTAATSGEAWAIAAIVEYARAIAPSIALLAGLIDPQAVIVGGPLAVAGEPMRAALEESLHEHLHIKTPVRVSNFDSFVSAQGAALIAIDRFEQLLLGSGDAPLPHIEPGALAAHFAAQ